MSMNRTFAAFAASVLCLALASGCATSQKSASKAKPAKVVEKNVAKTKSRYSKGNDNDYSLGDVDEKLLKRGQNSRSAAAFDSL